MSATHTTTATTSAAPVVSIKLELRFSNGSPSVYHRFTRGFDSAEELKSLCIKLWNQAKEQQTSSSSQEEERSPRLALRYSDDEGDQVIISTQHEWDECVRIYYENKFNVLRLNVVNLEEKKEKKSSQSKKQPAQRGTSSSSQRENAASAAEDLLSSTAEEFFSVLFGGRGKIPRQTYPTTAPSSSTNRQQAPSSDHPFHSFARAFLGGQQRPSTGCCRPRQQREEQPARGGCPAMNMKRWGCRPDLSEVRAAQEKRQKAVSNLLSILFNGEDKKEDDVSSTLPFGGACVNLFQLYQETVAAGNHLMDAGCLEEASRLLTAALEVFPSDKVHLYNLACVKSLEGSVQQALNLLLEAKKNGYNNLTHAAVDPDLENLRQSADFAKKFFADFLGQQQKNSTTHDESSTTTTTPAAKDNAAENKENNASDEDDDAKSVKTAVSSPSSSGASTTTNGNPDAVALVNMFPNLSFAEAEKVLERFHGDLSAAVNLLLE